MDQAAYITAGVVLSAFYVPQIIVLLRDQTNLRAYSLSKAAVQLAARLAMMPMLFGAVESTTILVVQSVDVALRTAEVAAALWSLRSQRAAFSAGTGTALTPQPTSVPVEQNGDLS